ncbi:alpha/beta fold hydrolase [Martelella endophytica]|uniref:Alpha/beta hydrolase n=1 Tax=Martelella endophytica TaxID=1486262 RepID=A0A0D5LLF9_MAREN|nr:alpha/beta fold hydrolase [Martelella endophytica]AJY44602.1 alpha/beta hydrolase [Martelella endophytica]
MLWNVSERAETSAGTVAWGRAGEGPPLVLAHGWPWSSYSWHCLVLPLSRAYTVYWYDMPGFGRSDKNPEQATGLDVQGQVFREMLEFWQIDEPTVFAHDFGGAVTLRAHLLHDVAYHELILMNVVALSPWGSDFFDHVGRHVDAFTPLPPHIHAAIVGAYIKGALVSDIDAHDLRELVSPWLTPEGHVSFYRQFAQADDRFTDEFADRLGRIDCPVAVLWGEQDPWIPIKRGHVLAGKIGVGLHPIPGVGHMPQLEAPRAVLDALNAIPGALPGLKGN